jgi:hypothetical protein
MSDLTPPPLPGYDTFLRDVKQRTQTAQIKAALAVNTELVRLYWSIENMTRGLSPLGDMGKRHPLQASALRPNAATHSRSPFVS